MSPGPLRRATGVAGLLFLTPTAVLLTTGAVSPADAGRRAAATLLAAVLVGRLAGVWLRWAAAFHDRQPSPSDVVVASVSDSVDGGGTPPRGGPADGSD